MISLPQSASVVTRFVPTFSIPFTMGAEDASAGELCCPEMYFAHPDDIADYAQGYASVAGHNATTRQLLAGVGL